MADSNKDELDNFGNLTNENPTPPNFLGDSWFTSVDQCVLTKKLHGANYIGVLKTNSSKYPKAFIAKTMERWPGGSHLLMKTEIDGVRLYALGYKYCKKKVLFFLFTEGAGHTEPGEAYEAKWTDAHGNRCKRYVPRPQVCSVYFGNCNGIDVHNQMCQKILRLEKCWVSKDGYFRIITTILGICVVDAWRGYQASTNPTHRHYKLRLMEFVDMLAKDMVENELQDEVEADSNSSFRNELVNTTITGNNSSQFSSASSTNTVISPLNLGTFTAIAARDSHLAEHVLLMTDRRVLDEGGTRRRTMRQRCSLCMKKTPYYCAACQSTGSRLHYWLCQACLADHKVNEAREYDDEMQLEHGYD